MKISQYREATDKLNEFIRWSRKERGYDPVAEFQRACYRVSEILSDSMRRIVAGFQKMNLNN
jgi:hypothetical protein